MHADRFPQRCWIAGISALILTFTGTPLVAQTYGAYGYGSPNPPQTYGEGQPDQTPPPPDYNDNAPYAAPGGAPYGAQPYANQPGYGAPNDAGNYPPNDSPNYGAANPNLAQAAQALNEGQLEQLVAPVALDPDTLLAQILAAATWPQQIIEADQWRQAQGDAPPQVIAAGANEQNWDPSVKSLTAFPQVLQELDQNLQWTTELGNAYYNEPDAVLSTVQELRQRAQAAGTLESTPQETVSDDQGYVQLAPPNPNVVYVPAYNPWTAYGQPIAPYPGFSLLDTIGNLLGPALQFGFGHVLSAFTPFGWLGWGLNWLAGGLFFHGSGWYPHNAALMDWGLPYGGPRWDWGHGGGPGWNRGWDRGYWRGSERGYGQGFDRGYGGAYRGGSGFGTARNAGTDAWGIHHGPARPPIGNSFRGNSFGERQDGREIQGERGAYEVRGGGEYGGREQQAWNRTPSLNGGRTEYGRGSYGSGYAGRGESGYRSPAMSYGNRAATVNRGWNGGANQGFRGNSMDSRGGAMGFRGGSANSYRGGLGSSAQSYRSPTIARNYGGESAMRGGFGNSYRGESSHSSGRGFSEDRGSSHSGGFHMFGGGSHASRGFSGGSHFHGSSHSGGGHFSSHGGGHSGGGGHSHGGGGHHR
ncbi:MAG: DUF3300 domain-containing protein [Acidobacteriaceae bacterium]